MGLVVIDPGFYTTVQDAGRRGYREWGVPAGGAFDRGSAALANALLGNSEACAVLELTLKGGVYEAGSSTALALAGAPMEVSVIGHNAHERPWELPLSFTLRRGERLVLGNALAGARTYLAVKGGWQTPLILGSRSREARVRAGDIVPADESTIATRRPTEAAWQPPALEPLRIIPATDSLKRRELFAEAFWSSRRFVVGSQSNRMGLRLQGEPLDFTPTPTGSRLQWLPAPSRSRGAN